MNSYHTDPSGRQWKTDRRFCELEPGDILQAIRPDGAYYTIGNQGKTVSLKMHESLFFLGSKVVDLGKHGGSWGQRVIYRIMTSSGQIGRLTHVLYSNERLLDFNIKCYD